MLRPTHPLLVMASLMLFVSLLPSAGAEAQTQERCFSETGFCVSGRIREFWEQNGGLPVFGLPITPQQEESIEGKSFQVQWFERNRLELHPENARPYDVLLGRLGVDRLAKQGRDWFTFPKSDPQANCRFFPETGHNVCGEILAAWHVSGLELDGRRGKSEAENLALFGLPLSDAQSETIEGNEYTVQWFERARFELHLENQPPYNVLLGLLGREVRTTPDAVPQSGQIVFVSDRDGNNEIYMMNADGSGQTRLTNHPAADASPRWSPDGTRIAFESERDGNWEIYVMNADGSGQTRLTNNASIDGEAAWSPDSSRIVFWSYTGGLDWDLYAMNADGSGLSRLTENTQREGNPDWARDGQHIVYSFEIDDNNWEVYVMNADGSNPTNLTNLATGDGTPAWSPDGARIAFWSNRDSNTEIYVMNADGSSPARLTNSPQVDTAPTWSPDGARIAFWSSRDGNNEIYVMNADGSGPTNLTNSPANEHSPDWSR
jgi:Tol biopolymer transport system component